MTPGARLGLIIPSSNRLTEPQFHRYAPPELAVHVTRLRMTGRWRKPLGELRGALREAAEALSDVEPDLIVFHCTANSMEDGLAHEAALVETIAGASGRPVITTAQAIREALLRLDVRRLVLISPYVRETNEREARYLAEAGFTVLHDVGLGLESKRYGSVPPEQWVEIARQNFPPEADGLFLSCTNTRMIEAIEPLERDLGKPVVASNQATLWACLERLGLPPPAGKLGRLFESGRQQFIASS
ncbi:MAG TPA: maleate cis-trans isomerase [candidate division Zixibacteria bacterium]|nr:maleate cis-trans isomerase [candidate division Zixibacteria bacterium]